VCPGADLVAQTKEPSARHTAGAVASDLVELGWFRGAYGLRGWVHVHPYTSDGDVLRAMRQWWLLRPKAASGAESAWGPVEVTAVRAQGAGLVAKWRGCDTREAAQAFKGWRVAVSRAAFPPLPEGQYYWVDVIGAVVVNRSGQQLGIVRGLRSNGVHDLLEVERTEAQEPASQPILIPLVAAYIDAVDVAARRIQVDWEAQW